MDDPTLTQIEFDLTVAEELSTDVLELLEDADADTAMGAIVMALTLGRLLSPTILDVDQEVAFLRAALEFSATYFTTGRSN